MRALLLAAGLGSRLRPLTDYWPKCLIPIQGRPLLEYWLEKLKRAGIDRVMINLHHHYQIVEKYIDSLDQKDWIYTSYEEILLGTAATIGYNKVFFDSEAALVIHADNWSMCDLREFIEFHKNKKSNCVISMMTFETNNPKLCGVVKVDSNGILYNMYEKNEDFHGNIANGAIYIIDYEVIEWINENPEITDFSTQVIPKYFGRIQVWNNVYIHRDIGSFDQLVKAQYDYVNLPKKRNEWQRNFEKSKIVFDVSNLIKN